MTLPLRADGGIDWEKVALRTEIAEFDRLREVSALTRKLCTQWHKERADKLITLKNFDGTQPYEREIIFHLESAAAFQKMKD